MSARTRLIAGSYKQSRATRFAAVSDGISNPVPVDERGEIVNGYPAGMYLPKDPGRRRRLLRALGYKVR
jgi:hypothetical protein